MKHTKCTSLGMPCSVTTALLWLFILGGLGVAMFLHRSDPHHVLVTSLSRPCHVPVTSPSRPSHVPLTSLSRPLIHRPPLALHPRRTRGRHVPPQVSPRPPADHVPSHAPPTQNVPSHVPPHAPRPIFTWGDEGGQEVKGEAERGGKREAEGESG
eukprot:2864824-Rhodomonas_salina.1